jgi:hypothetical protein
MTSIHEQFNQYQTADFPKVKKKCQTFGLTNHENLLDRNEICQTQ